MQDYLFYLKVSSQQAAEIQKATIGQSSNSRWYEEREWRLTASNFGQISHMTSRRNIQKLCHYLTHGPSFQTSAMLHGKMYEPIAIKKFEEVYIIIQ